MDHQEPNPETQQSELNQSIDELLDEIDASCAPFDGKAVGETDDVVADEIVSDEVEDTQEPQAGQEALEALDAVSENAEALLDETIGDLLDEIDEVASPDTADADDPLAGILDDLIDEDELEEPVESELETVDDVAEVEDQVDAEEEVFDDADELNEGDFAQATETLDDVQEAAVEKDADIEEPDSVVDDELSGMLDSLNDDLIADIQEETTLDDELVDEDSATADDELVDPGTENAIEEVAEDGLEGIDAQADAELIEESVDRLDEAEAEAEAEAEESEAVAEQAEEPVEEVAATEDQKQEEQGTEESDESILGDLDDALASAGDDLLMGDFETAEGELIDSDSLEDAIDPSLLLDQLDLDNAAEKLDNGGSGASELDDTESETAEAGSVDAFIHTTETPKDASSPNAQKPKAPHAPAAQTMPTMSDIGDDEETIESIWQTLIRSSRTHGKAVFKVVVTKGGPMSAKGLFLLSKPVAAKPANVRNSIGYIAIWTMFLATVLWVYTMFFRTTPTPVPSKAPTRVVSPGDDLEPIEHQMSTQAQP